MVTKKQIDNSRANGKAVTAKKTVAAVERPPYLNAQQASAFVAKVIEENREWFKEMANR